MTPARHFRRLWLPASWAMRTYRGTSVLLVCAAAGALAAAAPVAFLMRSEPSLNTRLAFSSVGATVLSQGWGGGVRTAAVTQQAAIGGLFDMLVGAAIAVGAVAALTLLSLFGARASDRAPEIMVRRAVGASRRLLAGSALVETVVLASAAVALGAPAGLLVARRAVMSWPGSLAPGTHAPFAGAVWVAGAFVVIGALVPLLFARERRITDAPGKPLELAVPAFQLGLSLVVLTGGALLAHQAGLGLRPEHMPHAGGDVFRLVGDSAPPAARAMRYGALLDKLSAGGKFETVSLTAMGGLVGLGTIGVVTTDCGQCSEGGIFLPWHLVSATHQFMSADSFHALGVRLVAGRGIAPQDRWGSEPVAVVNRGLALRHFQKGEAIGRKILLGDDRGTWHTVVGIVDDPPALGLGGSLQPKFTVYASVLQHPAADVDLLLRTRGGGAVDATSVAWARRALTLAGRPPIRLREERVLAAEARPVRWFVRWLGFEGWAMLALACAGIFALMRLWVHSLLAELGLRRAVGARRSQLFGFVLVRAAAVGLAGTGVGVWFGPAAWSALGSVLVGLPSWDTPTVARFALLLVGAAVAGALAPAIRAARTPPAGLLSWS